MQTTPADMRAASRVADSAFFVIGTGRCGTTLLQAMLSSHRNLTIPPETHFFAKFDPATTLREPVPAADAERYLSLCRREAYWRDLKVDERAFAEAIRGGVRSARDMFLWLLMHLAGPRGTAARIGEKTPRHERHVARICELLPNSRFIHVYRDPRDVVVSLRGMPWRSGDSLLMIARRCREIYDRAELDQKRLGPARYTSVQYEKLVDSPEPELRRLCSFLGEEFDPAMLRYHERKPVCFLESERSWKAMALQPLDQSRVARYRAALSLRQIRMIERTAGRHLAQLGYQPEPGQRDRWLWKLASAGELAGARLERIGRVARRRLANPGAPGSR